MICASRVCRSDRRRTVRTTSRSESPRVPPEDRSAFASRSIAAVSVTTSAGARRRFTSGAASRNLGSEHRRERPPLRVWSWIVFVCERTPRVDYSELVDERPRESVERRDPCRPRARDEGRHRRVGGRVVGRVRSVRRVGRGDVGDREIVVVRVVRVVAQKEPCRRAPLFVVRVELAREAADAQHAAPRFLLCGVLVVVATGALRRTLERVERGQPAVFAEARELGREGAAFGGPTLRAPHAGPLGSSRRGDRGCR
mmetsp:Transcript_5553/g.23043  ORF Transcript_5553/g.23043 Transcript_5553/m.23043 type:complete len:256 (-) Transcript_5553:274-1041(-)